MLKRAYWGSEGDGTRMVLCSGVVVGDFFSTSLLCFIVFSTRSNGVRLGFSYAWILRVVGHWDSCWMGQPLLF